MIALEIRIGQKEDLLVVPWQDVERRSLQAISVARLRTFPWNVVGCGASIALETEDDVGCNRGLVGKA